MTAIDTKKVSFSIEDVAELIGARPYIIRYWESEFREFIPYDGPSNQRLYHRDEVDILLQIGRLIQEEKYTVPGAKRRLKALLRAAEDDKTPLIPRGLFGEKDSIHSARAASLEEALHLIQRLQTALTVTQSGKENAEDRAERAEENLLLTNQDFEREKDSHLLNLEKFELAQTWILEHQNISVEEKFENLNQEHQELLHQRKQHQLQHEERKAENLLLVTQLQQAQTEHNKLELKHQTALAMGPEDKIEFANLTNKYKELQKRYAELKSEVEKIHALAETSQKIKEEMKTLYSSEKLYRLEAEAKSQQNKLLELELSESKESLAVLQKRLFTTQSQLQSLEESQQERDSLQKKLDALNKDLLLQKNLFKDSLKKREKLIQEQNKQRQAARHRLDTLRNRHTRLDEQHKTLNQTIKTLRDEKKDLIATLEGGEDSRIMVLEEGNRKLEQKVGYQLRSQQRTLKEIKTKILESIDFVSSFPAE